MLCICKQLRQGKLLPVVTACWISEFDVKVIKEAQKGRFEIEDVV